VRRSLVAVLMLLLGLHAGAGCSTSSTAANHRSLNVVVAENFWGSVVAQLAGAKATVTSIVANPNTDPHDYEPTSQDTRELAASDYAIYNGIGYDSWAKKALAANPSSSRVVLEVGKLVGEHAGDNPHVWYSPAVVDRFVARVTADLQHLDPRDASYFAQRKAAFETVGLHHYHDLVREIRARFAGTPIGASESIVTPLAEALGLRLVTPERFLDAVAEGTDPTATDKATVDAQINERRIDVFVFNTQNSTPDVQRLVSAAHAHDIPVTTVTETLTPASATFQAWQARQLESLAAVLARTTTSTT
jgi:zinc/manganese transport system substrate-binding protein